MGKPTQDDYDFFMFVDLSDEIPEFDPHCPFNVAQEAAMTEENGLLRQFPKLHPRQHQFISVDIEIRIMRTEFIYTDAKFQAINETLDNGILLANVSRNVNISEVNIE
jgi:hypothetical protein